MKPSSLLIAVLLGSVGLSACVDAADEPSGDSLDISSDDGKADGASTRYTVERSESGFRPLNDSLDTWAHGLFNVTPNDDGSWHVYGPWYKVTPVMSSPTWWRMDIRQAQGEEAVDLPAKQIGFFVAWRPVGTSEPWEFLTPSIDVNGSERKVALFTSWKMGNGTLEVTSPTFSGTSTRDYIWDDIRPELAFVPVPWETAAKMPGVGQFEISITDEKSSRLELHAYVWFDGAPFSCAELPAGTFNAGDALYLTLGDALEHSGADEAVWDTPDYPFFQSYQGAETRRVFDNVGLSNEPSAPPWPDTIPGATRLAPP